jgi:hypothetical protein
MPLTFLIGLPRSGKTTLANRWQNGEISFIDGEICHSPVEGLRKNRVVVKPDIIRLTLGHRYNSYIEHHIKAITYTMVSALLLDGYHVLLDDTHTTQHSIKEVLRLDTNADHYFNRALPLICVQRATLTNQEDLIPIIEKMTNNLAQLANLNKQYPNIEWNDLITINTSLPFIINQLRDETAQDRDLYRIV